MRRRVLVLQDLMLPTTPVEEHTVIQQFLILNYSYLKTLLSNIKTHYPYLLSEIIIN